MTTPTPSRYQAWADAALRNEPLSRADALAILNGDGIDLMALLAAAGAVRRHHFGDTVNIHILDNVRNGACPEDCGYCGQSRDSDAAIQPYKLKPVHEIVEDAVAAQQRGAFRFCMALAGRGPSDRDVDHMCDAIRQIKSRGIRTCLSSGLLDQAKADRLKEAGLDRLNHNLNTSRDHYPSICTTHTFDDRLSTLKAARTAGLGMCSGMIVGMSEQLADVVEVAFTLREIQAESIPVNFLLPIDGNRVFTPTSGDRPLDPQYVLRVLCMMRLVNPAAEVRIAAGREHHLRSLQPLALWPANSLFMDGYLLTVGQQASDTLRMILDAGFKPVFESPDALPPALLAMLDGSPPLHLANDPAIPTDAALDSMTALKPSVARKSKIEFIPLGRR
jgi:biotin synthase